MTAENYTPFGDISANYVSGEEEVIKLTTERDEARSAVAAMMARSCDSCKSYKSLSLLLGYCKRYKANITADWCCKDWEPKPLPENDRL